MQYYCQYIVTCCYLKLQKSWKSSPPLLPFLKTGLPVNVLVMRACPPWSNCILFKENFLDDESIGVSCMNPNFWFHVVNFIMELQRNGFLTILMFTYCNNSLSNFVIYTLPINETNSKWNKTSDLEHLKVKVLKNDSEFAVCIPNFHCGLVFCISVNGMTILK